MPGETLLVFCSGDLGTNFRLLQHARAFSRRPHSQVVLFGADKTSLPKEISSAPNIRHAFFAQFSLPLAFHYVFFPFYFTFLWFQFVGVFRALPRVDFLLISTANGLLDALFAWLARLFIKCKLVFDVASYEWVRRDRRLEFFRWIERSIPKLADHRVVSTRAMQAMLSLKSISSILIRDAPGEQFRPDSSMRQPISELLAIPQDAVLVAIPIPELAQEKVDAVIALATNIDPQLKQTIALVVFGKEKVLRTIKKRVRDTDFRNVRVLLLSIHTELYRNVLCCADLGVSFDGSRHGFDIALELNQMIACGVPVVAARCGCVPEYITEGVTGYSFRKIEELTNVMKKLFCEDTDHVAQLKIACIERAANAERDFDRLWETLLGDR
jgi:glycosyltransferase involved in cell wall biosynthesis